MKHYKRREVTSIGVSGSRNCHSDIALIFKEHFIRIVYEQDNRLEYAQHLLWSRASIKPKILPDNSYQRYGVNFHHRMESQSTVSTIRKDLPVPDPPIMSRTQLGAFEVACYWRDTTVATSLISRFSVQARPVGARIALGSTTVSTITRNAYPPFVNLPLTNTGSMHTLLILAWLYHDRAYGWVVEPEYR
ncbi:hypothetical protein NEOLEDRAFT_1147669 [Neolentinus lepideus HHB14362 ss-1]|uniref:Uncharacterized protein n=1 Tax=Neolentinus lepideus HHB14362 ss-1 TaxID=1314782 RepID=A0A165T0D0_9AGAM|nr:hypothetical protein NEOLEDRAFT_1147669 [Neolentinus lepideus HHB14362 ss-1]